MFQTIHLNVFKFLMVGKPSVVVPFDFLVGYLLSCLFVAGSCCALLLFEIGMLYGGNNVGIHQPAIDIENIHFSTATPHHRACNRWWYL